MKNQFRNLQTKASLGAAFFSLILCAACSAKVTSGGGDQPVKNLFPPETPTSITPVALGEKIQGTWISACVRDGQDYSKTELAIVGTAFTMKVSTYPSVTCTGSNTSVKFSGDLILGSESRDVPGAFEADFDLHGMKLLSLLKLEGETLYLGENSNNGQRSNKLKMDAPFSKK